MLVIHAAPYVPGRVRGTLRHGAAAAGPGRVLLLRQNEVGQLAGRPAGVILVDGALFAHPTLRLLSQGIPTVLAEQAQIAALAEGTEVFLDGQTGLVASPPPSDVSNGAPPPRPAPGQPLHTRDGVAIELRCSVTDARGAAAALAAGAAAIGLARSEYFYPEDGRRPDAAFLAAACAEVCAAAAPLPVTFRLVDIAGDKRPPWLEALPGSGGVLGIQGARLYAVQPVRGVYLAQLQALSGMVGRYPFKVLLPYVVSLAELQALHSEIRLYLPPEVPIGSMLETPAAALAVREFLGAVEFAALGCNDLMQCLFAADRHLPELSPYLDPYAPALYRFLGEVARLAGPGLDRVQVNGLLGQLPGVLPALIGLGYRAVSVDPVMLPWLAQTVRHTDSGEAARLAVAVRAATRPEEVQRLLAIDQVR